MEIFGKTATSMPERVRSIIGGRQRRPTRSPERWIEAPSARQDAA
jgi:hypothetical protein